MTGLPLRARVFVGLSLAACSAENSSAPAVQNERLPPGNAARAGSEMISVDTVGRIAAARQVPLREARELAIRDALFAIYAREATRGTGLAASVERAALARALLEELFEKARSQGAPTDAEVSEITRERWFELDRSAAVRTAHAVVIVKSPSQDSQAKAVAEAMAKAVEGAKSAQEFKEKAEAVPANGLERRVEDLPFITLDGRAFTTQDKIRPAAADAQTFDLIFARAANAIAKAGTSSAAVKTRFGYHVIFLLERLAGVNTPLEERRRLLANEVFAKRALALQNALRDQLTSTTRIELSRAADELTDRVKVKP